MFESMIRKVNKWDYQVYHNGERTNFSASRVKGFKQYIEKLAKSPELKEHKVYFFHNEPNFASFGMSEEIDLVWVDFDGKITHIEENFLMNKISITIPKTKYIYVFAKNTVKKNKILENDTLTHQHNRPKDEIRLSDWV